MLRGQLTELSDQQAAAAAGVQGCASRLDHLEGEVGDVAATLSGQRAEEGAGRRSPPAPARLASISDLCAVEQRVDTLAGRLEENGAALRTLQQAAEAQREASAAAARLLRSSSGGSLRADALEALQAHLLAQQERLAAQVEAAAERVLASVPGAVAAAVGDASRALERRLAGLAASKQELAALAAKLAAMPSREEVEGMLHALLARGAAAPPLAGEGLPAAGVKLKCLSCDGDLRPVHLASAGGAPLPADLRYSTLPTASPARTWAPPPASERPPPLTTTLQSGQGSPPGPRPQPAPAQQHRAGLGAPVGWMHRMRRGGEGGQPEGSGGSAAWQLAAAAGEAAGPGLPLALRLPAGASWEGSAGATPAESLSQLVREVPPPPPGLEHSEPAAGPAPLQRPKTSLPILGSPTRHSSPRIRATRASTPGLPPAAPTALALQHSAPPACADQPPQQPVQQRQDQRTPGGGPEPKLSAATMGMDAVVEPAPASVTFREAVQAMDN